MVGSLRSSWRADRAFELLRKERLAQEHPLLVQANPDKAASWEDS